MGSELSLDRGHRLETPRARVFTSEIAALEFLEQHVHVERLAPVNDCMSMVGWMKFHSTCDAPFEQMYRLTPQRSQPLFNLLRPANTRVR